MPFETLAEIEQVLPGNTAVVYKTGNILAGGWGSMWAFTGQPTAGAFGAPLAGTLLGRSTTGGIILPSLPPTPNASHIGRVDITTNSVSTQMWCIADRIWHNTLGTALTSTAINSPALTRYTTGDDVELWLHVSVATSSTTATLNLNYTNELGVAGRVTATPFTGILPAGRTYPINLAAGDTGVRSVQSYNWSAAYTAGTVHLVMRKRLATFEVTSTGGRPNRLDAIQLGMPSVMDDACLEIMTFSSVAVSSATCIAELNFLQE